MTFVIVRQFENQITLTTCDPISQVCDSKPIQVSYQFYPSYQGKGQKSGAYIFRPATEFMNSTISYSPVRQWIVYPGQYQVTVQMVGVNTNTFVRVYNEVDLANNVIEIETFLSSIHIRDLIGKEVVMKVQTNINNNQTFYTDSNGLEMQKRILNYRPTFNWTIDEPSAGNYYPINAVMYIDDVNTGKRVAILNDRTQGGAVLSNGCMEFMIHRRLLMDDARGVGEPLNETNPWDKSEGLWARMRHYVVFSNNQNNSNMHRLVQQSIDQFPILLLAQSSSNSFVSQAQASTIPTVTSVPPTVKFYLRPLTNGQFMMRLHNMDEKNAQSVGNNFGTIREMTLTGNQLKATALQNRLVWNQENTQGPQNFTRNASVFDPTTQNSIVVQPLELRCFYVTNPSSH